MPTDQIQVGPTAVEVLQHHYPQLPVVGVIEPGAQAAVAASRSQRIAVIATEGTIGGGAYQSAIRRLNAAAHVTSLACSLFVAMAEEGWTEGAIAESVARRYLDPLFDGPVDEIPDTLVLGCTHFPLLAAAIRSVLPAPVQLVDSAQVTAAAVAKCRPPQNAARCGTARFLATDGAARFARVGGRFLGMPLSAEAVEIIDL